MAHGLFLNSRPFKLCLALCGFFRFLLALSGCHWVWASWVAVVAVARLRVSRNFASFHTKVAFLSMDTADTMSSELSHSEQLSAVWD
jgi:hypothetical protein